MFITILRLQLCKGPLKASNIIVCNFNVNFDMKEDTVAVALRHLKRPFYPNLDIDPFQIFVICF